MDFPKNKNIVLIDTPHSFIGKYPCPNQLHIGLLQIISFLKKRSNNVFFINMCSNEHYLWKEKPAGVEGATHIRMSIIGRNRSYLIETLDSISFKPAEIWISCSFTFDYDIVESIIKACRSRFPYAKIIVGGAFVRVAPILAEKLNVRYYEGRIEEADVCLPDFSVKEDWNYGIFQLATGCPNNCSFCIASLDKPRTFPVDFVIGYMNEFYKKFKPKDFYNWDSNVLVFRHHLEEFLDSYSKSGMKARLRFDRGLQPNLIDDNIMRKMVASGVVSASLPLEAADSETILKYNKPYSIISCVKMLDIAKRDGLKLSECHSTFVIGYPEDNFHSIFRTYLTILKFGAVPCPFPVFLFPRNLDYQRYYSLIKHKDLSELHGHLWPLIPCKKVKIYRNLFNFLSCLNVEDAKKNLMLLPKKLREIFLEELKLSEKFVDLCLRCKEDTIPNLKAIERELEKY